MINRSVNSAHKALTCPDVRGTWALHCLAKKKLAPRRKTTLCAPAQTSCHLDEVGLWWKGKCGSLGIGVSLEHWWPFLLVCLLWLLRCLGRSTIDDVGEDEQCAVLSCFISVVPSLLTLSPVF